VYDFPSLHFKFAVTNNYGCCRVKSDVQTAKLDLTDEELSWESMREDDVQVAVSQARGS